MNKLLFRRQKWPNFSLTRHPNRRSYLSSAAARLLDDDDDPTHILLAPPLNLQHNHATFFDSYAYARAFKACIDDSDSNRAKAVHTHSLKRGACLDLFSSNILLNLYEKTNLFEDALTLFDEMPDRNMVCFVVLIQGLFQRGRFTEACQLFWQLHLKGHELNLFIFTAGMKMVVMMEMPELGTCLRASICKLRHESNVIVGATLIDVYSLGGMVNEASEVFDGIVGKGIVAWTGMSSCYVDNDFSGRAVHLFNRMRKAGLMPNNFTLTRLLKACVSLLSLELRKCIHCQAIKCQYEIGYYVGGALHDVYAKFGDVDDACAVFELVPHDDVILWSFMIARYAQGDRNADALEIFDRMRKASIMPNEFSFSSVLHACANMEGLAQGAQLHGHVVKVGLDLEIYTGNALIDVYFKCGKMEAAMQMFSELPYRNDVT